MSDTTSVRMRFLGTPDTWHTNYEADTHSLSYQLPPRSVRRTTGSSDLVFSARRASTVAWDPATGQLDTQRGGATLTAAAAACQWAGDVQTVSLALPQIRADAC